MVRDGALRAPPHHEAECVARANRQGLKDTGGIPHFSGLKILLIESTHQFLVQKDRF
jgi:hypothetical protein